MSTLTIQQFGSQSTTSIATTALPDLRAWALTGVEMVDGDEAETSYIESNPEFHATIVDRLDRGHVAPTRQDFPEQLPA